MNKADRYDSYESQLSKVHWYIKQLLQLDQHKYTTELFTLGYYISHAPHCTTENSAASCSAVALITIQGVTRIRQSPTTKQSESTNVIFTL